MDSLIVSIAIAITLGLAAACNKDQDEDELGEEPGEASTLDRPGELEPATGGVPRDDGELSS